MRAPLIILVLAQALCPAHCYRFPAVRRAAVKLSAASDTALATASADLVAACAAFGPLQEEAAVAWIANLKCEGSEPATLLAEEVALFEMCSAGDGATDSRCQQLDAALQNLQEHASKCSTFRGWGDKRSTVALWNRGTAPGTFTSALPTHLQQQSSPLPASDAVHEAVDRVRSAVAAFGPAQASYVEEWLAEDSAWDDVNSLYERRIALFDECTLGVAGGDGAKSKCAKLTTALDGLMELLELREDPNEKATARQATARQATAQAAQQARALQQEAELECALEVALEVNGECLDDAREQALNAATPSATIDSRPPAGFVWGGLY
jgi:hypothetical protein